MQLQLPPSTQHPAPPLSPCMLPANAGAHLTISQLANQATQKGVYTTTVYSSHRCCQA
jgi:hypothetical protein